MMVKKYTGKTTREALRKMRDELGNDAMILSSKQTPQGIEMVAMAQAEVNELVDAGGGFTSAQPESMPRRVVHAQAPQPARPRAGHARTLRDLAQEVAADSPAILRVEKPGSMAAATPSAAPAVWRQARTQPQPAAIAADAADPMVDVARAMQQAVAEQALSAQRETAALLQAEPHLYTKPMAGAMPVADPALMEELKNMRAMLENQMSGLAWREAVQRNPQRVECWRDLNESGFSPAFARTVAEHLPAGLTPEQARQWLQNVLLRNLPQVAAGEDLVDRGGVWALVGPTGVGKTTTTAKLAARCVVKYGAASLGLITTDTYRVGAHDQLKIYAKILGVQVYSAQAGNDLQSMLNFMARRRLVLIDTVGMGQRDARVAEQLTLLSEPGISRLLLLNAAAQPEMLEDVAQAYGGRATGKPLAGAILTKLDEAVKTGAVLDTVIRHRLPLHFITNGQRVPEDLHLANPQLLVHRALKPVNLPAAFALSPLEFEQKMATATATAHPIAAAQSRGHSDAAAYA
ncbi:MAG: flagellar biosynthesis protein FlhF [Burkholderiaceae bacterium]|nr:MAG: flagellar biosynthesis protein FlhF [Burkholderiaceae bacterium]